MVRRFGIIIAAGMMAVAAAVGRKPSSAQPFDAWLGEVRIEAAQRGLAGPAVDAALSRAQHLDRVIELDGRQPELTQTFWRYIDARVTPDADQPRPGLSLCL